MSFVIGPTLNCSPVLAAILAWPPSRYLIDHPKHSANSVINREIISFGSYYVGFRNGRKSPLQFTGPWACFIFRSNFSPGPPSARSRACHGLNPNDDFMGTIFRNRVSLMSRRRVILARFALGHWTFNSWFFFLASDFQGSAIQIAKCNKGRWLRIFQSLKFSLRNK